MSTANAPLAMDTKVVPQTIKAVVEHEGKTIGKPKDLKLDELLALKETIDEDRQYLRIRDGMSQGDEIPPIIVEPYVPFASGELTPLRGVVLIKV
jgi:hypothetical protein